MPRSYTRDSSMIEPRAAMVVRTVRSLNCAHGTGGMAMLDQLSVVLAPRRARAAALRGEDAVLAVVGVATLLAAVVFTTVITTVGETAGSFAAATDWQTWALGGMSLGLAGTLLSAGAIADVLGHRRVFVLSSLSLAASSALAALAPSMLAFVVARVLQGAGAAGIVAAGLGLIGHVFPQGRRGRAPPASGAPCWRAASRSVR